MNSRYQDAGLAVQKIPRQDGLSCYGLTGMKTEMKKDAQCNPAELQDTIRPDNIN